MSQLTPRLILLMLLLNGCADHGVNERPQPDRTVRFFADLPLIEGISEPLTLTVNENSLSLTVIALGDSDETYVIDSLIGPDGQRLIRPEAAMIPSGLEYEPFPGPLLSKNRASAGRNGVATVLCPNSPDVELPAGEWQLRVRSETPTTSSVDVVTILRQPAVRTFENVLKLYFFVGNQTENGSVSVDEEAIRDRLLERIQDIFAQTNVAVEVAAITHLPQTLTTVTTLDIAPNPETMTTAELFMLNQNTDGVGVFLVDRVETDELGSPLAGLAGGTPGPSEVAPNAGNGIVVATSFAESHQNLADVIAHEIGHYLGLHHTRETAADLEDTLRDTDRSETNLMFPIVGRGPKTVSVDQSWVLTRSAALSAREGPGR